MATDDHTPVRTAANSTHPITLDLPAIHTAAADIWDIRRIVHRLDIELLAFTDELPPDELARCGVMAREIERVFDQATEKEARP
ncbi:hypothetical protein [Acidiphilium iwatense]|uniref:Acyl carrier protein n=1 Tax=Acidiphilium iwatense TaxID=768198 RepID=A0ABS9E1G6_9PROT|nr:hypothetical protein [Acidiphilium iwatense]MCF3947771.1 hypothetical protein [Acidiphilium iwatense]